MTNPDRSRSTLVLCAVACALLAWPAHGRAAPDHPCGSIGLDGGQVASGRPLRALEKLPREDRACVDAVGKALGQRTGLRAVTIAVRLPDAQRAAGAAPRIADVYRAALVAGGVPEGRISVVAPPAAQGAEGTVAIAFTERRGQREVAVIESVGGRVTAGDDRAALKPVETGARLPAESYVATGAGSTTWIGLADGSRLRLSENSLLLIGRLHLNDSLERVVRLRLVSGELEAEVRSAGKEAVFDVSTRFGIIGVRGTRFRLVSAESGTRLETLEGRVEFTDAKGGSAGVVTAGQGAAVAAEGDAGPTRALLPAPTVTGPLEGRVAPASRMAWQPVDGAGGYVVELASDAEFTFDVRRTHSVAAEQVFAKDLPAGRWFWRVAAVGDGDFVGAPSKIYAVDLGGE